MADLPYASYARILDALGVRLRAIGAIRRSKYAIYFLIAVVSLLGYISFNIRGSNIAYFEEDGAVSYYTFKYLYTTFLASSTFPIWNFLDLYGQPMEYTYIAVGPTQYIAIFLGWIFNIKNTYILYHVSIFLQLCLIPTGLFLIGRRFRMHPIVPLFVSLGLALVADWVDAYYFSFRAICVFPLLFFYAIRFAETLNFRFLGTAALVMSLSFFEGITYTPFLYFYDFLIVLVLLVGFSGSYRLIGSVDHHILDKWTLLSFLGAFLLAGIFAYDVSQLLSGELIAYRNGRTIGSEIPLSLFAEQTTIDSAHLLAFLNFHPDSVSQHRFIISGGSAFLVFFLFGSLMVFSRQTFPGKRHVVAFLILAALSVLATQGKDYLATMLYYILPGMKYYRYGYGFYSASLVAAAIICLFGFNLALTISSKRHLWPSARLACYAVVAFIVATSGADYLEYPPISKFYGIWHVYDPLPSQVARLTNIYVVLATTFVLAVMVTAPSLLDACGQKLTGLWHGWRGALGQNPGSFDVPAGNGSTRMRVFLGFLLTILNVVSIVVAVEITRTYYWLYLELPRAQVEDHLHMQEAAFPVRRDDTQYYRVDFSSTAYDESLPAFMKPIIATRGMTLPKKAELLKPYDSSYDPNRVISIFNTSQNVLYQAGEWFFSCTPWLDNVTIAAEAEKFFRLAGGFDTEDMKRLVLGLTSGGPYLRSQWVGYDPMAQRVLGCSEPIVRFARRALFAPTIETAAEKLKAAGLWSDVITAPESIAPNIMDDTAAQGNIVGRRYWGNEISFDVSNPSRNNAWVVIADTYDHRWRAWINGAPVPVWQANISFKAVEVPSGESDVVLRYADPLAMIATWASAIGLPILFVGFFVGWLRQIAAPPAIRGGLIGRYGDAV